MALMARYRDYFDRGWSPAPMVGRCPREPLIGVEMIQALALWVKLEKECRAKP
jgi:hypothetical protein